MAYRIYTHYDEKNLERMLGEEYLYVAIVSDNRQSSFHGSFVPAIAEIVSENERKSVAIEMMSMEKWLAKEVSYYRDYKSDLFKAYEKEAGNLICLRENDEVPPFVDYSVEEVHRLFTAVRKAEVILNEKDYASFLNGEYSRDDIITLKDAEKYCVKSAWRNLLVSIVPYERLILMYDCTKDTENQDTESTSLLSSLLKEIKKCRKLDNINIDIYISDDIVLSIPTWLDKDFAQHRVERQQEIINKSKFCHCPYVSSTSKGDCTQCVHFWDEETFCSNKTPSINIEANYPQNTCYAKTYNRFSNIIVGKDSGKIEIGKDGDFDYGDEDKRRKLSQKRNRQARSQDPELTGMLDKIEDLKKPLNCILLQIREAIISEVDSVEDIQIRCNLERVVWDGIFDIEIESERKSIYSLAVGMKLTWETVDWLLYLNGYSTNIGIKKVDAFMEYIASRGYVLTSNQGICMEVDIESVTELAVAFELDGYFGYHKRS